MVYTYIFDLALSENAAREPRVLTMNLFRCYRPLRCQLSAERSLQQ